MKKILLSFVGIACALLSNGQLVLNELYVRPSSGRQEYFELKNTSPAPVNADCYTLVSYFNEGGTLGFYVVNIPTTTVAGEGYLVGSSQAPGFNYQDVTGTADFSWNDGNVNRYVYSGGVLVLDNTGAPYTDIFKKSNGSPNGENGVYGVFLFEGSTLVDAFLGSSTSIVVPDYITQLGQLTNTGGDVCGNLSYNFANINNEADDLFSSLNQAAGTDNGYARMGAGCGNNGEWIKTSSPGQHTPGMPNAGNYGEPNTGEQITATVTCAGNTSISYDITGGIAGAFPVKVSLYFDANGNQALDTGDVYMGQQTDLSVSEPTKTFTKASGQEDFIFVFDGKGHCYDTVLTKNCPVAIVLPVSFQSFTAANAGSGVSLKWTTATESNNKGFYIQKLKAGNTWETLGFVASAALAGNSSAAIDYSFSVASIARGTSQFRLQQVDLDGKFTYSDVRMVRNEGTAGRPLLYPNPSRGIATVLFTDGSNDHDVIITDMSGRTLKQWQNVSENNLKLISLKAGVYMIHITDGISGTKSVEKLVVSVQ